MEATLLKDVVTKQNVNSINSVHVSRAIRNTVSSTSYYFYASTVNMIETIASTFVPESYPLVRRNNSF